MTRAFVGYYVPKGAPRTIAYAFEARAIGRIELNPAGGGFVRAISVEELDEKFDEFKTSGSDCTWVLTGLLLTAGVTLGGVAMLACFILMH